MAKLPSHSGERPVADAAPNSGETPFDPSHFARHEFPVGLREELIHAEKPRIDPKFLQDTVPPNLPLSDSPPAAPVVTSQADPPLTPAVPKHNLRPLVIGVLAALAALLIVGLLIRPSPVAEPADVPKTALTPIESTAAAAAAARPTPSAPPPAVAPANAPAPAPSALPSEPAVAHDKPHKAKPAPKLNEAQPPAASESKPAPAPNAAGKQPWIDGL